MVYNEFEILSVPGTFKPGYNEYAWDDKDPEHETDQDLCFSNGKYSASNNIFGLLIVCLFFVGLVATS